MLNILIVKHKLCTYYDNDASMSPSGIKNYFRNDKRDIISYV